MEAAAGALPWICCTLAVVIVVAVPLRLRNEERRRNLQLSLNVQRWGWVLAGILFGVYGAVAITLGLVLLGRLPYLWGLLPLGAAQLFVIGYYVYIDRRPFPVLEEDDLSEDAAPTEGPAQG